MGQDFIAFIQHRQSSNKLKRSIERLDKSVHTQALSQVSTQWHESGFADLSINQSHWIYLQDYVVLTAPSSVPNLENAFVIPSGFHLTFAKDAICVTHPLRWHQFLTAESWQNIMLEASKLICEVFEAQDCIITGDYSPVYSAFRDGSSYRACLEAAQGKDGEATLISDMYFEVGDDSEFAIKPVKGKSIEPGKIVKWSHNKPLPEGWKRPMLWDSAGYWRLPLS